MIFTISPAQSEGGSENSVISETAADRTAAEGR
jgi:hypothetical protein